MCVQANIHSIMGSEDQVLNLMRLLDEGIQMAESIEEKLTSYDLILAVRTFPAFLFFNTFSCGRLC